MLGIHHPKMRKMRQRMKDCAHDYKRKGKPGRYQGFMAKCLKKG